MKFTTEFLKESLYDKENTIYDNIVDHRRWSVDHVRVFKHEGKFYRTYYSKAATEGQDESPYEYDGDAVECSEVVPVEKVITVYEEKA